MLKQERPRIANITIRGAAMFGDLSLFISLCMAWVMVWQTLRRERKELLVQLKRIQLVPN